MGIDKDYSIEDIRSVSIEKLYDVLASCQSPGYYQMAVEELQRRFLADIAVETRNLTTSTQHVESVTKSLQRAVGDVDSSIRRLADSSDRMERLTRWLIWFTVALLLLTVAQVVLIVKDQFNPKPTALEQTVTDEKNLPSVKPPETQK